jgi:carboxynorspermidine decarboxylase
MMIDIKTPYYVIDLSQINKCMQVVHQLKNLSSVKCLLALKAFSTWPVFPWFKEALDGTTSSSIFELKLGKEKFGKEAHAYSVAYSKEELNSVNLYTDKVIFNSINQLTSYAHQVNIPIGLRVNPLIGFTPYEISNPVLKQSRLGESNRQQIESVLDLISGVMIHNNCDNTDFKEFSRLLDEVEASFSWLFQQLSWISLGGGILFTAPDFPLIRLHDLSSKYDVQV